MSRIKVMRGPDKLQAETSLTGLFCAIGCTIILSRFEHSGLFLVPGSVFAHLYLGRLAEVHFTPALIE